MRVNDFQLKVSGIYNSITSQLTEYKNGFTYDVLNGCFITHGGYCVGVDLGSDTKDLKDVIDNTLVNGIDFIGGWLDTETNEFIFDSVLLFKSKDKALKAAKENNQKAIFNLDTKELILLNKPIKQTFFNNIADEFDTHVRQSIPLFSEIIENVKANILYYQNLCHKGRKADLTILDICGSTGKFGHDIIEMGFKGKYFNIDGSPKMINIANELAKDVNNVGSGKQMFNILGGYLASWTDESGTEIKEIDIHNILNDKFTFGLEILGFQFFTKERENEIKELKNNSDYCIFIEKFSQSDNVQFEQNERLKDVLHKSKYFDAKQLEEKREAVLYDMHDYLYNENYFVTELHKQFKNVKRIYKAGNFAGFICSDLSIDWYNVDTTLIENKFNYKMQ